MVNRTSAPEQRGVAPPATEEARLAALLARGVCRELHQRGYASLLEFALANGRRADIMALDRAGEIAIVEVKSSLADFRADGKWPDYWEFCDRLYFAISEHTPPGMTPMRPSGSSSRSAISRRENSETVTTCRAWRAISGSRRRW